MYTAYFGFRERPFTLTCQSRFISGNGAYQETYTHLLSGIRHHKGFLLLTGEEGTGKTTLLHWIMRDVEASVQCLFFDSAYTAPVTLEELLTFVCAELGLADDHSGRLQKLKALHAALLARAKAGGSVVLLIDEAHRLGDDVLGNLHVLAPVDMSSEKLLLQTVLVGRPELEQLLARPQLRQLKQRIALQYRLRCLDEVEVGVFIQQWLQAAGCERHDLFTPEALQRIAMYSGGIPRLINTICDNALLRASQASQKAVSATTVDEVAHSLQLKSAPTTVHPDDERSSVPNVQSQKKKSAADETRLRIETVWPLSRVFLVSSTVLLVLLAVGISLHFSDRRLPPKSDLTSLHSLTITDAVPAVEEGQEVVVAEGQQVQFAIEAASPQTGPLQYVWLLDGREQSRERTWTYLPQADAGGPESKEVLIRVMNRDNDSVERRWRVRVKNVNHSPLITTVLPSLDTLEIVAGEEQSFAIEAADPDKNDQLAYVWWLDGQVVAQGPQWKFTPSFAANKNQYQIIAAVTDKEGAKAEKQWMVTVLLPPPQPPVIRQVTPKAQEVKVAEGHQVRFAIEATSPQAGSLQYVWLLDGREQSRKRTWTYLPQVDEGGSRRKEVTGRVIDQHNQMVEQRWQVDVRPVNHPPVITTASPAVETLEVTNGEELEFSVEASDPDTGDRLSYIWLLDGHKIARGPQWKYRALLTPPTNTPHQIEVRIADTGGLKTSLVWRIVIQEPAPPPLIVDVQPQEVATFPPPLSKPEVEDWLEIQRQAWEEKNVDLLVELGVMTKRRADQARKILSTYKSFGVALDDVDIRIIGDRADVSFSRVDTIDGKAVPHPARTMFVLERGTNGRLTARPQEPHFPTR